MIHVYSARIFHPVLTLRWKEFNATKIYRYRFMITRKFCAKMIWCCQWKLPYGYEQPFQQFRIVKNNREQKEKRMDNTSLHCKREIYINKSVT